MLDTLTYSFFFQQAPLNTRPSARQSAKSTVVRDDLAEVQFLWQEIRY